MRFVDLFAGLGGFHKALQQLGHHCVFACEIDDELRELYRRNYPSVSRETFGDIRLFKDQVPAHDILCAGFPCQPFSKSGAQLGLLDKTQGTLFHEILYILKKRRPQYLILENVGNFERHDRGRTWQTVRESLEQLGYSVRGTEHVKSGGPGLISPHHLGYPHSRERFYIVARLGRLPKNPLPKTNRECRTTLLDIVQSARELTAEDRDETGISEEYRSCIEHWNALLEKMPEDRVVLPSFPIWSDELDATYPFETNTPYAATISELEKCVNGHGERRVTSNGNSNAHRAHLLGLLPSYARCETEIFPDWKIAFIRQNREWFQEYRSYFSKRWIQKLREFAPSLRKLEWNCQGEKRDLWKYVLQFRPSGLRVKRYSTCPSLVALTTTQIPLLGPKRRYLTRVEGLRLQGFGDDHRLPASRSATFRALGNAVHVGVVREIARTLLEDRP